MKWRWCGVFSLEAQAVSKLNHPNIVQTFDFGQADGALYLVMEYIKGDDSSRRCCGAMVRGTFARAARFFAQVCSGSNRSARDGDRFIAISSRRT